MVLVVLLPRLGYAAPTLSQLCEAAVESAAAKFAQCRLNAEAKYSKSGDAAKRADAITTCSQKLSKAYAKALEKYGMDCPVSASVASFEAYLGECVDAATAAAEGAAFPACGDGVLAAEGEQCDGGDLGGATCAALGFPGGALACTGTCVFDTSGCVVSLCGNATIDPPEQCDGGDLGGATCEALGYALGGTLACGSGCAFDASGCVAPAMPGTGVTATHTADKNDGIPGAVAVPDDGTLQRGAALAMIDNGDGTITDLNTGLVWEKKGDDGGLHDKDNVYRWRGDGSQETIWDWLDDVNAEGGTGFAGHADWRIPNAKELLSIVDYDASPAVPAAFHAGCVPGCSPLACSCTVPGVYWTSTSFAPNPTQSAWRVGFDAGGLIAGDKPTFLDMVRAVRGGP